MDTTHCATYTFKVEANKNFVSITNFLIIIRLTSFIRKARSFFILIDHLRLRIADPRKDNFRDFPALMAFYLNKGRAVYAMFSPPRWKYLREHGVLDPEIFRILPVTVFRGQVVYQIIKK